MKDITSKITTLREATAEAELHLGSESTAEKILSNQVPKGNIFEMSRAAGLLAVKNTFQVIPDCHPLPVESCEIESILQGNIINIKVKVKTIYRTGVEVEAMHGASVVALTMYDMLKPLDKKIEIRNIRLVSKKGGKSDFTDLPKRILKAAVIVCCDSIAAGKKEDKAGKLIMEKLQHYGIDVFEYGIISDDPEFITSRALDLSKQHTDILIFCGGTGLSPRDNTPEALLPLIDREVPGIMEAARSYGQQRMPWAMVSRGISGYIGKTLLLTLPGSSRGSEETMDALFPYILHLFRVGSGASHQSSEQG